MKGKKCPYCGRRIAYNTVFHEKKHGLYKCSRCKKESKVKTDIKLMIAFLAVVLVVVLYIVVWQNTGFHNNFAGIFPPIIILIIFYFCTPFFVRFVPLKKYMEKKVQNNEAAVIEEVSPPEDFVFDRKIFEQIKNNRRVPMSVEQKIDKMDEENDQYVPVIKNVSEAHASSDAPLKKVVKPASDRFVRETYEEEDVKPYIPKKTKPDGSKYTANRKL